MKQITVLSQKEFDALPKSFKEFTEVRFGGSGFFEITRMPGNCTLRGSDNCTLRGSGNCTLRGSGNCTLTGSDNCTLTGSDNCTLTGYDNCTLTGYGNCTLRGSGSVSIHMHSDLATALLFGFAVAFLHAKKAKVTKKSKTSTIIKPELAGGVDGWVDREGISPKRGFVTLYKRVSHDFKTQEGTRNETLWAIGSKLEHPAWNPQNSECGEGKFHACSTTFFCDQFRSVAKDRYIAIKVPVKEMYAWDNPSYPHKIAFRTCEVLHEVDLNGNAIHT